MCTKYLNANIAVFKEVIKRNNDVVSFLSPFDCICAENSKDGISIRDFSIVTYINMLESNGRKANNMLDRRSKMQVCIRFTKCAAEASERLSVDLDEFTIDTANSDDIIYGACVPYLNYKRITHIDEIKLDVENPRGSYVIKVLVKEPMDRKYTVQSLYQLKVE